MAHQTGIAEYPVQLMCGDRATHVIDGAIEMVCPVCSSSLINSILGFEPQKEKIIAFELREWHAKCQQCPSGKWTGKDERAAYRFKASHSRTKSHHSIVVDFMIPDHAKRLWKTHYGQKRTPARIIKETDNGTSQG